MIEDFGLNSAPFGLLRINADFEIATLNPFASHLDSRLVAGNNLADVFAEFKGDRFQNWLETGRDSIDLELKQPQEMYLSAKAWIEPSVSGFLLLINAKESTAKELRNELLSQAAEQSWEAICITDAELDAPGPRFVYVNRGFTELMGFEESEVLGKSPRILQGPLTDKSVLARLRQNLNQGTNFHGETINYKKNGEMFWLEWKISPVKNESGEITHFIAFQRDVSEFKAAQQRIADFHSVLSHELRAPLTSILGSLQLLDTFYKPESDEGREFLEIALFSTDRLASLVNDLLELHKMESGQLNLKLEKVSAKELVEAASKGLLNYRPEENVHISITGDDLYVKADKDRMIQVLINLISNAMKFSPANQDVGVVVERGSPDKVRFSISDSGPGISESNQLKLFTKFQQLASEDGVHRQGTGLGLSIVKALIEQHGGEVGVFSKVGQGSTFWVELEEVALATTGDETKSSVKTLLLVEDDLRLCKLIKFHLATRGFNVHAVSTIKEARIFLAENRPYICVIDMLLPDGNGLVLAEEIQRKNTIEEIPILMTSASRPGDSNLNSPISVNWLYKPFDLTKLADQIKEILASKYQKIVVCENSQPYWDALPQLLPQGNFEIIDCSEPGLECSNYQSQKGSLILKFDGSPQAEKNIAKLATSMTGSKAIVICTRGAISEQLGSTLSGLIIELISAEKLSEIEFMGRLRNAINTIPTHSIFESKN